MSTHLTAEEQQQQQQPPSQQQAPIHVGSPEHQEELQTVIQSIQDAASPHTALVVPISISEEEVAGTQEVKEEDHEEVREGAGEEKEKETTSYWDASAMAPLNAASAVSSSDTLPDCSLNSSVPQAKQTPLLMCTSRPPSPA